MALTFTVPALRTAVHTAAPAPATQASPAAGHGSSHGSLLGLGAVAAAAAVRRGKASKAKHGLVGLRQPKSLRAAKVVVCALG